MISFTFVSDSVAKLALGTKVHQYTRKAIAKRKPALISAIRKFNKYCETLARLHKPEWAIPLPQPLPTTLSALRDGNVLMEDVWISRSPEDIPRWLEDPDVREGIRAMLKRDRCVEETRRLGLESDNMCRWFGREYLAVQLALATPSSGSIFQLLFCGIKLNYFRLSYTNYTA